MEYVLCLCLAMGSVNQLHQPTPPPVNFAMALFDDNDVWTRLPICFGSVHILSPDTDGDMRLKLKSADMLEMHHLMKTLTKDSSSEAIDPDRVILFDHYRAVCLSEMQPRWIEMTLDQLAEFVKEIARVRSQPSYPASDHMH